MATITQNLTPDEAKFGTTAFPQWGTFYGTGYPSFVLAYDADAVEYGYWKWQPTYYGSGSLTVDIVWYADTSVTTGHTVRWEVAVAAITPNTDTTNVETKAFDTAATVDDALISTAAHRLHLATVTLSTVDSMADGDECWFRLGRIATNGADTLTGDALVTSVRLSYSNT